MNERDERLVAAAESQAESTHALTEALAAPERREHERELRAAFPPPFKLCAGRRGVKTMLWAFPGFAELWEQAVPEQYLALVKGVPVVSCPCGTEAVLEEAINECPGRCGRWYLAGDRSVRVHRFDPETADV